MTTKNELLAIAADLNIVGRHKMNKVQLMVAIDEHDVPPALNDERLDTEHTPNAVRLDEQRGIKTSLGNDLYLPQQRRRAYKVARTVSTLDKLSPQHQIIAAVLADHRPRTLDQIAKAAVDAGLVTRQKPAYIAATAMSKFHKIGLVTKLSLSGEA